tara:strand:- start:810 stop:1349 length:540 start_codon:yes stop_codon:yes gene_type:complete
MSSELEMTNVNIELENTNELRWIIGNLFFTSMILCIALIQMYIYYHHDIKAKNVCFATFFIVLIALLVVSKNIPLSVLSAIIVSNLIVTCGNLDVFDKKKSEEQIKKIDEKIDNVDKNIEKIAKRVKNTEEGNEEPVSDLPSKKFKDKYVMGSNFKPYLTNENNDLAYPTPPESLKFSN